MQYEEVAEMVAAFGYPYAYRSFPQSTAKAPPYVVYYYDGYDDMYADNSNYQVIAGLRIELYTRNKDFTAEASIETVLRTYEMTWRKDETFIEDEQMYLIIYESEVIINGK